MTTLRVLLALVLLGLSLGAPATEAIQGESEYRIKAAYLYKFAAYVEWPAAAFAKADTPVTIGILGADDMASELIKLKGGPLINNRAMEVKLLKSGEPLTGIQVLFVGRHESAALSRILDRVQTQPVLSVTELAGALGAGSIINFVPVDDRIRFEVSVAHAERSGLKISARLLAVAQKIESRRP